MHLADKITISRIFLLPFMWFFALSNYHNLLIFFLIIFLLGDILDGYFARKFKHEKDFGSMLDGTADVLLYSSVLIWSYLFYPELYIQNKYMIFSLIIFLTLPFIISLVKYNKIIFFHLFSSKALALLIYISFLVLVLYEQLIEVVGIILVLSIVWNTLERIMVLLSSKKLDPDLKSVFNLNQK